VAEVQAESVTPQIYIHTKRVISMKLIKNLVIALTITTAAMVSTMTTAIADGDLPMVAGEIKKVKPGKITIKHEEIPNLDMPGMTMVFRIDDDAMVAELEKGDMVNFTVTERDGKMYIVAIEPKKE